MANPGHDTPSVTRDDGNDAVGPGSSPLVASIFPQHGVGRVGATADSLAVSDNSTMIPLVTHRDGI
jgi:hypothetical protein